MAGDDQSNPGAPPGPPRRGPAGALRVSWTGPEGQEHTERFTGPFTAGRDESCEIRLDDDLVSARHVTLYPASSGWWIRDLGSTNGTLLDGQPIEHAPLEADARLGLSADGPELRLVHEAPAAAAAEDLHLTMPHMAVVQDVSDGEMEPGAGTGPATGSFNPQSVTDIIRRYDGQASATEGTRTRLMREAFSRVRSRQRHRYRVMLGVALGGLILIVGVAVVQALRLQKVTRMGVDIFYQMKELEIEIERLLEQARSSGDRQHAAGVEARRHKLEDMRKRYQAFVEETGIFDRAASEEDRLILRMARVFGECELAVPVDFADEVKEYIGKWRQSSRLATAVRRIEQMGYAGRVFRAMLAEHLPPQFLYLALQESDFLPHAIGPRTRWGIAKGFWQFIPSTAVRYGLRTGPLVELRVHDPADERFDFDKSTAAAARYLRDIYNAEAQASGLLVLAAYNWGHGNVRRLIRNMPENPRQRNFWRLMAKHAIPKETYDYVFLIFSAAVIGENPALFGFEFDNPLAGLDEVQPRRGP